MLLPEENPSLILDILDAGDGGKSFARLPDGMAVFLRGDAVPGDRVRITIQKRKKRLAEGVIEEIVQPSPDRVEAPCVHFGLCGGCRWQQLAYTKQLEVKTRWVSDALSHLGGIRDANVLPAVASPDLYRYRNKVDLVFSRHQDGPKSEKKWAMGFHTRSASNRVFELEECHLISEDMNRLANAVRDCCRDRKWNAFSPDGESGLLRSVMIRKGERTGERMVNLVTTGPIPDPYGFAREVSERVGFEPESVVNTVASGSSRLRVESTELLAGQPWIYEELMGNRLRVSAASFLQPNTLQAEEMIREVLRVADLSGRERVLDLYCGMGSFSLALAAHAKSVFGYESIADAVRDARVNALENGRENTRFTTAILGRDRRLAFPSDLDCIVTDPPRSGMERVVIEAIRKSGASKCIYVSCYPASLARDARLLCAEGGYTLKQVQPFDLFPQTEHIESVALFSR